MDPNFIVVIAFQLIVLIFSVMVHEVSHGAMALYLGDETAKRLGRLTLNPLKHIDLFGSIILPVILVVLRSPILIGWAKPVPYNPYNLKDPKKGAALIGAAGPAVNLIVAIVFALLLRLFIALGFGGGLIGALGLVVLLNLLLAIFNLVPIPPLDGSKVLFAFLPTSTMYVQRFLERHGFLILLLLIFMGLQFLWSVVLLAFAFLLSIVGVDPGTVFGSIMGMLQ